MNQEQIESAAAALGWKTRAIRGGLVLVDGQGGMAVAEDLGGGIYRIHVRQAAARHASTLDEVNAGLQSADHKVRT